MWLNEKRVFVTATDTEVGKTFVAVKLMQMYQEAGLKPGYFKPVATGCTYRNGQWVSEDVLTVRAKTGYDEEGALVNPAAYEIPAAPLIAARLAGETVPLERINECYRKLHAKYECLVVEGIGGILVPVTESFQVIDWVKEWNLGVLIVTRPNLGTINHTALTVRVLRDFGIRILGIVISHASGVEPGIGEKAAFEVIASMTRVPVLKIFPHEMDWNLEP